MSSSVVVMACILIPSPLGKPSTAGWKAARSPAIARLTTRTLLEKGVNIKVIQERFGHRDAALDRATRLLESAGEDALPEIQTTTGPGNLSKSIFYSGTGPGGSVEPGFGVGLGVGEGFGVGTGVGEGFGVGTDVGVGDGGTCPVRV